MIALPVQVIAGLAAGVLFLAGLVVGVVVVTVARCPKCGGENGGKGPTDG